MGSDLSMSPPTPDEHRIVRHGEYTAVYSRHTDGIYGDTRTWHLDHFMHDPTDVAFEALTATHPGWKPLTLDPATTVLEEQMDYEALADVDRDIYKEITEQQSRVNRAREKVNIAVDELATERDRLNKLKDARGRS